MNGYNFSERVRQALAIAREEAARLHHHYVGTEHLVLGVIRVPECVAVDVLRNLSVDLAAVRASVESVVKAGQAPEIGPDRPYTSRAKKVLELAMSEARELGHSFVGTEHLLLGLLREEKGIAAQVLMKAGLTLEAARAEVLRILGTSAARAERAPEPLYRGTVLRARPWAGESRAAFVVFWWTLGIVVIIESLRPIVLAMSESEPVSPAVILLAIVEIVGALLFLWPRLLKVGAAILLSVFAIAILIHAAKGEFVAPLFVYATGTAFVLARRTGRPNLVV